MKNQFYLFVIAALLINLCSIHAQEQVSMQSLLREMVDRKQLVEYPESIPYKAMQASSYNPNQFTASSRNAKGFTT